MKLARNIVNFGALSEAAIAHEWALLWAPVLSYGVDGGQCARDFTQNIQFALRRFINAESWVNSD